MLPKGRIWSLHFDLFFSPSLERPFCISEREQENPSLFVVKPTKGQGGRGSGTGSSSVSGGGFVGSCVASAACAVPVVVTDSWLTAYRDVRSASSQTLNLHIKGMRDLCWKKQNFLRRTLLLVLEKRLIWLASSNHGLFRVAMGLSYCEEQMNGYCLNSKPAHFRGHFRWTALSITHRTSLGDGWWPVLSSLAGEEALGEAARTWVWLGQCSFLPRMLPRDPWWEAQCRNQNPSWASLWQLTAVGLTSSPRNSEEEKGQSRDHINTQPWSTAVL